MADSGGYRWGWSIAGHPTAGQLAEAAARYAARFGRFPSLLFVSPQLLADGIAAPLGVAVEADPHMAPGLLCFALPADELPPAEVERLAGAAALFLPVAFLEGGRPGLEGLGIIDGGFLFVVFLFVFAAALAMSAARRGRGGNDGA